MTFDPQPEPVAQEHGQEVVAEIRRGEQDVGVGQPVSEEGKHNGSKMAAGSSEPTEPGHSGLPETPGTSSRFC